MMKAGEKVVFSLGREKGVIVSVQKNGMVVVEMEIGMTVKVHVSEIAIDYSSAELHEKPIKTNRFYIDKTNTKPTKKQSQAIDLHFNANKVLNLENGQVLSKQLDLLAATINAALAGGTKELIIIHGVGVGTLKREVHIMLNNHKQVKGVFEADHKKYGKGATRVVF